MNKYTGPQQYTGRAKRVTPSVARPIAPPRLVRRPRWRRLRRPQKYAFSLHFPSQSGVKTVLAGGGCGHLHRKKQKKPRKMHATCGDDETFFILLLVFAQVHIYKPFWRIIFNIGHLLLLHHSHTFGAHSPANKTQESSTDKQEYENEAKNSTWYYKKKTKERYSNMYFVVTGIRHQVLDTERNIQSGRKERVKNLNSRGVVEIF